MAKTAITLYYNLMLNKKAFAHIDKQMPLAIKAVLYAIALGFWVTASLVQYQTLF